MFRRPADFDIDALYHALDAERQSRGLSWQQAARDISSRFDRAPSRPLSASTLTGMRTRRAIDGDGVLQMLLWLGRTPESFVPGGGDLPTATLPDVGRDRILRFDARAIYAALDVRRVERRLTWDAVASEIGGVQKSSLTRLANGGRVGFPHVMRIARWLDRPAASLTRVAHT